MESINGSLDEKKLNQKTSLVFNFYQTYQKWIDASIFLGGFFLDIFTLGAIDDSYSTSIQVVYISLLSLFLGLEIYEVCLEKSFHPAFNRVWKYKNLLIHFLLGSLFSIYLIFFFVSSSIFASFVFLIIIASLFVLNELPFLRNLGLAIRTSLFTACLISFFAIQFPILLGYINWLPFVLAVFTSFLIIFIFHWYLAKNSLIHQQQRLRKYLLIPSLTTSILYVNLYGLGLVPPVPLSLKHIGIYHQIAKEGDKFILSYHRPKWKFWQSGAQTFVAKKGDPLICFVSIYSPTRIQDKVYMQWFHKEKGSKWKRWDNIQLPIAGGRREGFRGYGLKRNYQEGKWKVLVTTQDDREIGRIYFDVRFDESLVPEFRTKEF